MKPKPTIELAHKAELTLMQQVYRAEETEKKMKNVQLNRASITTASLMTFSDDERMKKDIILQVIDQEGFKDMFYAVVDEAFADIKSFNQN